MDDYTAPVTNWLNKRFQLVDDQGYYRPHQPVYGIDLSTDRLMEIFNELCLTYSILLTLSDFIADVDSLLDVGCAEGYTAHTVFNLLAKNRPLKMIGQDLSREAIARARSLFDLPGVAGDIHHLPFPSRAVDLVICSETIEHVTQPETALKELDRVAGRFLLLTTPANWKQENPTYREPDFEKLHQHINEFTQKGLHEALGKEIQILGSRSILRGFNAFQQTLIRKRWVTRFLFKLLVWSNYLLSQLFPAETIHFVVVKARDTEPRRHARRFDLRIGLQMKLLEALFEDNAVPRLRLSADPLRP